MGDFTFNADYIRKLIARDNETERHFTSHFGTLLRIKLRAKLRSPQLIEDVRQETFLRVLQKLRQENGVHNPERLGAFVNSVCNNVMLESFRAAAKFNQIPEDAPEIVDGHPDSTDDLVSQEKKRMVEQVLKELPAKDRELLRQVYYEEREKRLICSEMGVNAEYLRVLIHRAKGRFRAVLEKTQTPPPV